MLRLSHFRPSASVLLSVFLVVSGCDLASSTSATEDAPGRQGPLDETYQIRPDGGLDLQFEPVEWSEGERLAVSASGVSVQSTAGTNRRHTVSWAAPAAAVQRVVGLLGGEVQSVFNPDGETGAGSTEAGPTSVHYIRVCDTRGCATAIEYDYERSVSDHSGTTRWSAPDGADVLVDRLRFEVEDQGEIDRLAVSSPEPLNFTDAR